MFCLWRNAFGVILSRSWEAYKIPPQKEEYFNANDLTLSVGWVGNLEVELGGMSVTEIQNETRILHWSPLGAVYMSWAGPVSRAGSVYRDDCSA